VSACPQVLLHAVSEPGSRVTSDAHDDARFDTRQDRGHHPDVSLDLAVLTPANAGSLDQALGVYSEDQAGVPDDTGELEAYATEVYDAYGDDDWPFAGDPNVERTGSCCWSWLPKHGSCRFPRSSSGLIGADSGH
jgi:hypothetical protein